MIPDVGLKGKMEPCGSVHLETMFKGDACNTCYYLLGSAILYKK